MAARKKGGSRVHESHTWQALARLGKHTLESLAIIGAAWLTKWALRMTGEEHEWWALILLDGLHGLALVWLFFNAVLELIGEGGVAIRNTVRRIRGDDVPRTAPPRGLSSDRATRRRKD